MNLKTEYRNQLPHIAPIGACFFVTFRLADALPQAVVKELRYSMLEEINRLKKEQPVDYKQRIKDARKKFFGQYDHQLDVLKYGACYLERPEIAKIITGRLHELDGKYYDLIAYSIMPNHVHVLFDTSIQVVDDDNFYLDEAPDNYVQLNQIMKLIKGSTATYANRLLGRNGKFWQKDSFDHYVRTEREFENIISYILNNPVKAGLVEAWDQYPYSYLRKS